MSITGTCPQCHQNLNPDRIINGQAICACGWFETRTYNQVESRRQKTIVLVSAVFAVVTLLLYAHLLEWGRHATSIPILKAGAATGLISSRGLIELITACTERNHWSCAEKAYVDLHRRHPENPDILQRLARFQSRTGRSFAALDTYAQYFRSGGGDARAMFHYAQILEDSGRKDDALNWYRRSIASADPARLPVHATESLVKLLMNLGRLEEARSVILDFHGSAGNAPGYLGRELDDVEQVLQTKGRI